MILHIPDERTAAALERVLRELLRSTQYSVPDTDILTAITLLRPLYNQLLARAGNE